MPQAIAYQNTTITAETVPMDVQGIVFVLRDAAGRVLMERCPKKAARHGCEWFIPGGRIEEWDRRIGYAADDALYREMREELGCRPKEPIPLPIIDACGGPGWPAFLMQPYTVKPLALMRWLVRLVTPPGGHVLDPFAGSGSTWPACMDEGFSFTGVELLEAHAEIIYGRARQHAGALFVDAAADAPRTTAPGVEAPPASLFDDEAAA